MNDSNAILEGIQLMLIGMSTVFVFLSILVYCTSLMQKFFAQDIQPLLADKTSQITDEELVAVSTAVHAYRKDHSMNKEQK